MSIKALAYAIELTADQVTRSEKLLLLVMADCYNEEEGCAWPSVKLLSKKALLTAEGTRKVRQSLTKKDLIRVEHRHRKDGSSASNRYRFPALETAFRTGVPPTPVGDSPQGTSARTVIEPEEEDLSSLREEKSSSSAETAETTDPVLIKTWYSSLAPSSGFRSPIRAPSNYFATIKRNGDLPPSLDLQLATYTCQQIRDALVLDHPEESPRRKERFLVPMPAQLPGLADVAEPLRVHSPSRVTLRTALYNFVRYDDDKLEPEVMPHDILPRIAKRPDIFSRAVENAARES